MSSTWYVYCCWWLTHCQGLEIAWCEHTGNRFDQHKADGEQIRRQMAVSNLLYESAAHAGAPLRTCRWELAGQ
ncbi:hypothetical protein J3F83DRAFT_719950 [Trichoderma novae-zelandiae]